MKSQAVFEGCTWERLAKGTLRRGGSLHFHCLNSADLGKMLTLFSVDIFASHLINQEFLIKSFINICTWVFENRY